MDGKRYRARIDVLNPDADFRGTLQRSKSAAIKEAVDHILESGCVIVDEVSVKRVTHTEYVEVE